MHLFTSIHNYHNDTICVPTRMYCIVESCVSLLGLGHIYHWTKCIFSGPMSWHHMYTYQDLCPGTISIEPTCLDHMYIHQDSCPWAIYILTRTYVLGPYVQLPGPKSLDHIYIYLPGPMSLGHMNIYQDLCPWAICILTRTYVLGTYEYLPGLCPWIICLFTRTYVLGPYVYMPGPQVLGKKQTQTSQHAEETQASVCLYIQTCK